jgi:23S rRNA (adenine2503-C2)-methyltransferase
MPINKKWNIDALLDACLRYYTTTKRRISFEYTLISGKNDSKESALELAALLNKKLRPKSQKDPFPIHVNLIPVNPVNETGFSASDKSATEKFAATLEQKGIRATVRRRLGADINASCGQLRRERS